MLGRNCTTKALLLAATCFTGFAFASAPAHATNIPTFGTPGRQGQISWQGFFDDSLSGSSPTLSDFNIFSYYGPGFTGTPRDQLQYEVRFAVGYADGHNKNTALQYSSGGLSVEYYYNVVPPAHGHKDKMSPDYRLWWTSPQIVLNLPTGNTYSSGYGNGTNNYGVVAQDNNYIAIGRFGISTNPITATYNMQSLNGTVGSHNNLVYSRGGLSLTLGDTAAGVWLTRGLMVGVQTQYNINSLYNSTGHRSQDFSIGPTFIYTGLFKHGFFVAGNFKTDVEHSANLKHATLGQIWLEKYF